MLESRSAIETETGDADDGELHHQHIACLPGRVVAGGIVDGTHGAEEKRLGIKLAAASAALSNQTQMVFLAMAIGCLLSGLVRVRRLIGAVERCVIRLVFHRKPEGQ